MSASYNKTINLPSTGFSMKANLAEKELRIQKIWEDADLYRKLLDKNSAGEKYMLHDGPPYANGNIHMGHALNRVLKDIMLKFKLMQGFNAPFVPGWDCHGLPVEYELLKRMGKNEADEGIDKLKFRKKAAAYALKFVEIQKKEFKRLGLTGDWDNPYLTLDKSYEETIIDSFSRLYNSGYIYRELKPVHWCFSCRTALAEAEVEYSDIESPSIYIKFEMISEKPGFIKDRSNVYALVWTTTPWTLPANTALCFHPDSDYAFMQTEKGEVLIIAEELSGGFEKLKKLGTLKGSGFLGASFKRPFGKENSTGINAGFVSMEDGTGIVHIAPGHGEEDYLAGKECGLEIISPVDEKGCFTCDADVEGIENMHVFKCDPLIVQKLDDRGLLFKSEKASHSYPHCWRCKNPVIFRATRQWFLDVDKNSLREKILDHIKEVKWFPPAGEKRITAMIQNRPDWCLSRQRMWGVPIPIFYCEKCFEVLATPESFEKVKKMVKQHGSDGWFHLSAREILGKDIKCSCSSNSFRKEEDILDVWFDSGVSSMAVLEKREGHSWPADMYLEGSDQHRGWFQTSIIPSVAIKGVPPYKAVFTHGFTVDKEGKKMSKSLGNVTSPQEVIKKYGADLLRLWVATENYFRDVKISENIFSQTVTYYRRIRNTIRFILANCSGLKQGDMVEFDSMEPIDRFMLDRFSASASDIIQSYEKNLFYKSARELHEFCNGWLSSFYFNIIKDLLYVSYPSDRKRRSAQTALVSIGKELLKLAAPVIPHTAEEGWQKLREEIPAFKDIEESVFLSGPPDDCRRWAQKELQKDFDPLVRLREEVLGRIEEAKNSGVIKDPLESEVLIKFSGKSAREFLNRHSARLKEYFIVSSVLLEEAGVPDLENSVDFMGGKAEIKIEKSPGEKCARCWIRDRDTGLESGYEDLCPRCSGVVKKLKSEGCFE